MKRIVVIGMLTTLTACGPDYYPAVKDARAVPPECPDWRHSASINFDNSPGSNFGCATAINQHVMVTDKRDLFEGQGDPRAQTETSVRAVERLYQGELTETTKAGETVTTGE